MLNLKVNSESEFRNLTLEPEHPNPQTLKHYTLNPKP